MVRRINCSVFFCSWFFQHEDWDRCKEEERKHYDEYHNRRMDW